MGTTQGGRGRAGLLASGGLALAVLAAGCGDGATQPEAADTTPTGSVGTAEVGATPSAAGSSPTQAATDGPSDRASTPSGGGTVSEQAAPGPAVPVEDADGDAASVAGLDQAPAGSTDPVQAAGQGGSVLFTEVRVASQDGFDRVVFEYEGDGVPGYRFGYEAEATQQATGEPIDLPGSTGLRGFIRTVAWTEPGNYEGPKRLAADGTRAVTVVDVGVLFEGDQDPYIGVVDERPFRVTVLSDPTRIVVDIAH